MSYCSINGETMPNKSNSTKFGKEQNERKKKVVNERNSGDVEVETKGVNGEE
ncbi:hypothetical protein SLEP1_g52169 [Rubroshorea leprosula]|uniref:Uncharacterized protein n=1 Tax=Rubroshorea leprosula TaxID=152421 RepID=A0AAV5M833_9ROSI|nr:hypothetical protein SLEP1_g52169 [Rubroshorea leprosula]